MIAEKRAQVALVRGQSRYESVAGALVELGDALDLRSVRQVLVKPNFVSIERQLASTHVDAVRAVLDAVRARYDGRLIVAEGPALGAASEAFKTFGYESLRAEYDVELLDLNTDEVVSVQAYDRRLRPQTLHMARTVVESDYRISVGPPKTHDTVVVTLSIKNMVMGALMASSAVRGDGGGSRLQRRFVNAVPGWMRHSALAEWAKGALLGSPTSSKLAMHQGYPVINLNLALLAPYAWPHLVVVDGWVGMEGEGPSVGDPVDWQVALAGVDALAVDVLGASLMGFDPTQVGYLQYCARLGLGVGALEQIETRGNLRPEDVRRAFRPHPTVSRQLDWQGDSARLRAALADLLGRGAPHLERTE
ncbi:MAG: DUF362 domain-containing protein [Anaerolineales bacterium]|nr:DUF362 domain-containing protein [Anaerolineales bacterium]